MIADALGVRVWELDRVALHWQEERRVILEAQYEAKIHKQTEVLKKGAMNVEIFLPEF